jgi:hypothetical protein
VPGLSVMPTSDAGVLRHGQGGCRLAQQYMPQQRWYAEVRVGLPTTDLSRLAQFTAHHHQLLCRERDHQQVRGFLTEDRFGTLPDERLYLRTQGRPFSPQLCPR